MAAHEDDASAEVGKGQADEGRANVPAAERIAKVLARAGVASRRDVERLIAAGRVALNGETLRTPAVRVSPTDVVTLDGRPVAKAEPTRLFRYHKPPGLVTTHRDPQGRPTVFDALPAGLPRLISVGRLDLNSEGLLLLTNDGELARRLELPASGLVRRYRARARGRIDQAKLDRLQQGLTVAGVRYGPIEARLEPGREDAANQWLSLSLAEGKNREVRKVLEALGLIVNRLIRLAYGPYELGDLKAGEVAEVALEGGASVARPPKQERKQKRKPGWAKPKVRRPGSRPARGRRAAPRGPKPSASPGQSSPARPQGPRPAGGPKRRG